MNLEENEFSFVLFFKGNHAMLNNAEDMKE